MVTSPRYRALTAPGWTRDPLWTRARMMPSFDIDANFSALPVDKISGQNLTTFTRAASATYVDVDGVIRTAGANVLRRQWDATNQRWGWLVEEARTNLLLNSETLSTQNVTVAATAYTLSFYGTGSITRSGTSTGTTNGTGASVRTSVTFTPTAGTLTLTVSGSVTNANLEAGSFPTSWIPTTGLSATRDADVWTVTGTNFSRWYRQDEGTVYAELQAPAGYSAGVHWDIGPAGGFGSTAYMTYDGSSWTLAPAFAPVNMNSSVASARTAKVAAGLAANNSVASVAGLLGPVDSSCAMPASATVLTIGKAVWSGALNISNGTISRLTYFPARLSNPTLQELTR